MINRRSSFEICKHFIICYRIINISNLYYDNNLFIYELIMQRNKETKEEQDDADFLKDTNYDKVEDKCLTEEAHLKYVSISLYVLE